MLLCTRLEHDLEDCSRRIVHLDPGNLLFTLRFGLLLEGDQNILIKTYRLDIGIKLMDWKEFTTLWNKIYLLDELTNFNI